MKYYFRKLLILTVLTTVIMAAAGCSQSDRTINVEDNKRAIETTIVTYDSDIFDEGITEDSESVEITPNALKNIEKERKIVAVTETPSAITTEE